MVKIRILMEKVSGLSVFRYCTLILIIIFSCALVSAQEKSEGNEATIMRHADFSFDHQTFNFGTFDKSTVQTHEFKLVNTGNAPLVIKHVATGCGCTKVEYPREPIAPQKEVVLKVTFDGSKLISGHFRKSLTVYTNAPRNYTRLFIRGETK